MNDSHEAWRALPNPLPCYMCVSGMLLTICIHINACVYIYIYICMHMDAIYAIYKYIHTYVHTY